MGYRNIEEYMRQNIKNMKDGKSKSEIIVSVMEKIIRNANSWEMRIVVESLAGYLQMKFDEGELDFRELSEEKLLEVVRIMYSPKEYTEDLLLGETPRLGMEFMFPYHLFPKHSSIAIYGAGNASRVMYRQACQDKYVEVVGVFDQNMAGMALDDIIVRPAREIINVDCEYILIAICNEKTAKNITARLISMGVPADKIRWDGDVYHRNGFYRNMYLPMVEYWNGNRKTHEEIFKEYRKLLKKDIFDYVFPYHLFNEGERVVIYGAGDIGKKFWRQGTADKYIEIVGIVDKNADYMEKKDFPIENVNSIKEKIFDSVLISVHGPESVIEEIRLILENLGVEKEKIKWDGRTYHQNEFRQNVYLNLIRAVGGDFASSTQMIGNLCRNLEVGIYKHVFPYEFFRKGERIVIFGAGEIGRDLYRQARRYGYVDVVAIIDNNNSVIDAYNDIPVLPLDAVMVAEPDAILIASEEKSEAEIAMKTLMGIGVDVNKILWDVCGYRREMVNKKYFERLAQRSEEKMIADRAEGFFSSIKEKRGTEE